MAVTNAVLNKLYETFIAQGVYVSLHVSDPGVTGAGEVTGGSYARKPTSFPGTGTNGSGTGSTVAIPVPASTTVTHIGIWKVVSGGTASDFVGGYQLPTSMTFSVAGTANVTPTEAVVSA